MINSLTVKKGDVILMGRPSGQKAKCEVKRVNEKTCTVTLLEQYGTGRGSMPGHEWRVPWSGLWAIDHVSRPINGQPVPPPPKPPTPSKSVPLEFNMFMAREDVLILEAIGWIYGHLSPENLSCDGELPIQEIRWRSRELNRKLGYLQQALGRSVSESELYDWISKREEAQKKQINNID